MTDATIQVIVGGGVTIVMGYLTYLTAKTKVKVEEVHEIVNSQRTQMEEDIKALRTELRRLLAGGAPTPITRNEDKSPPLTINAGGEITVKVVEDMRQIERDKTDPLKAKK